MRNEREREKWFCIDIYIFDFGVVWFSRYEGVSVEGVNYIYIYICVERMES